MSGWATLESLGLAGPETERDWARLDARESGMRWRHLGRSDVTMAELARALRAAPGRPPRTGHVGDWDDIWRGRSGILDYNAVVCRELGIGYPLLYDFTQTETAGLDGGDTLFLPGSLMRGGQREELRLLRWNGDRFVPHDRAEPLFLPYVQVRRDGGDMPLLRLHRENDRGPVPADHHSALWARHRRRIGEILVALVRRAPDDRALAQVFGRTVRRDGGVVRTPVVRERGGFRAGDLWYGSAEALVSAALAPVEAALARDGLGAVLREMPSSVPLASVDVVALSYALLGAHRPGRGPAGDGRPDVHIQWGALAMAGHPPGSKGYFARRAGKVGWMYDAAAAELPWVSPVMFVIAPVAPYFLWTPEREGDDLVAVEDLLRRVGAAAASGPAHVAALAPAVRELVAKWLTDWPPSGRLRTRFRWESRVAPDPLPESGLAEPAGFGELTMAQACLVVSCLVPAVTP
ncbi:hypothetical protein JOL79_32210 [Microbispora sp. RL4-1S]|uniref:Uncharacterized protein n=1 Tax=Microbispora oryzae TaxID=2806554 RepID=A0A940WMK9_9ACTN|nr:DUF6025 family protein [Microbispora oryzae]MBP2708454.1 hypothetical protein [Microbispora oryzae]